MTDESSGTGEHLCEGCDCPQVLEDVTGEEFVLLMRVVSALRVLQTVSGRQQLVELVVEQAFLEQALNTADPDTVDRLLQCTRQALPLFSVSASAAEFMLVELRAAAEAPFTVKIIVFSFWQKNVHSTRFITYFCEHVLPNLSELTSPAAELDIQLEVRASPPPRLKPELQINTFHVNVKTSWATYMCVCVFRC